MRSLEQGWGGPALAPLSWLYGLAIRLRNVRYDRPGAVTHVGVPVISVGNLTVGGTGKTPLVARLARGLLADGERPAVVSRGYGGTAGRGPLLVSGGAGPLVEAARSGDEPHLLARTLSGVRVWVGSDRIAAARAAARHGATAIVLDDGFQHRRLARDLDIVLLDPALGAGPVRMLPAGPWREPLSSLRRADVVLITRGPSAEGLAAAREVVRRFNRRAPVLSAGHRVVGFFDREGRPVSPPSRALAFCGIGNPTPFRADLERSGVELVGFRAFRDHRPYPPAELAELERAAGAHGAVLVTTDKDFSRIASRVAGFERGRLLVLRIEATIEDETALWRLVRATLGGRAE